MRTSGPRLARVNPLHRIDRWTRAHPVRTDVVVAGLLLVFLGGAPWVLLGVVTSPEPLEAALTGVITLGLILPWAFRRARPVASAAVVALFGLLHLAVGPEFSAALALVPMTVYNLAARAPRRASLAGLAAALAGGAANGLKVWLFPAAHRATDMVQSPPQFEAFIVMTVGCWSVVLTLWAFGDVARNRRLAVQALEDRARRLEVQARQERELAAADERSHIAREMHDIVAHSLQVIISQSDGARYAAATRPEVAVEALGTIGQASRAALADMRQLLGVLRHPGETVPGVPGVVPTPGAGGAGTTGGGASPAGAGTSSTAVTGTARAVSGLGPRAVEHRPAPRLSDLPALIETLRLSGLEISLLECGSARRALPAGGELTAYRIVQEALTNTLRHGGPQARAFVTLAWTARGLDIQVDDDGRGAGADPATAGSGQGLRGLAERVALFGGTVETGPRVGAGFRVAAQLPYSAV